MHDEAATQEPKAKLSPANRAREILTEEDGAATAEYAVVIMAENNLLTGIIDA